MNPFGPKLSKFQMSQMRQLAGARELLKRQKPSGQFTTTPPTRHREHRDPEQGGRLPVNPNVRRI